MEEAEVFAKCEYDFLNLRILNGRKDRLDIQFLTEGINEVTTFPIKYLHETHVESVSIPISIKFEVDSKS